ncbi:sensor histidine kinase [Luteimonas huabeiensis]|uniref:sensor histidine kinase n=1 Tax=Luteimonas huabeiensis TaxID=1244513 RepID=UPI000467BBD8|nr:HAMP domain-containing sensor histidine kinase [Luteimonas huabeiensis]
MFKALIGWFDRLPIPDAVDRRNARVIQALLLFLAITIPAMLLFGLAVSWPVLSRGPFPWQLAISLGFSLGIAMLALVGVRMIRRGRFRPAVRMLLVVLLVMLCVNAAANGFERQLPDQLAQMLVLILSGLVLGRRTLWTVFAVLLAVVAIGALRDAFSLFADTPLRAFYNVPQTAFSYLLVAILIDRTTEALRESLRESNARGTRLEAEMRERERTHAQLIHAQKKEITERMAAGVAHDVNNIFAVIAGFAAERHHDDAGSDRERAMQLERGLEAVEAAARRGMATSRRLLRFNRPDRAQPERFDASDAAQALRPMLVQLLDAGIALRIEPAPMPTPIEFDRSEFELMLLNFASNTRDAIEGEGRFSIRIGREGAMVRIDIADDGPGMPEAVLRRVFEPFFSTKPAESGTGLGLAVVHDLVRKAGGDISVASQPGTGTAFAVRLPLAGATGGRDQARM